MAKRVEEATPPGGWVEYINEMVRVLEEKYKGRNQRIEDVFKRRARLIAPQVPPAFKERAANVEMRLPLVQDLIRRVVGLVGTHLPEPTVVPTDEASVRSRENSSLREKWLQAAYDRMNEQVDTFGQIVDALAADGQAVWKVRLQKHLWAAHGVRKKGEGPDDYQRRVVRHRRDNFPFVWEHVATQSYLPVPDGEGGLAEVYEVSLREALPLAWKFNLVPGSDGKLVMGEPAFRPTQGLAVPLAGGGYPQQVRFIEHWTKDSYRYMVDDEIVAKGNHSYGRPPYFHALGGVTSIKDPAYQGISIADPLLSLQDVLDALITIQLNWAFLNGFPPARLRPIGDDPLPLAERVSIEWQPGETIDVPGHLWEWVPAPPVGADINLLQRSLKEVVDQVTLAPILYGLPPGADASGVLANTLIAVAKSIFGPALANLSRGFDDTAGFMQRQVEKLGDPVPVYAVGDGKWLELSPKDVDGYYRVRHQLHPVIPAERQVLYNQLVDALSRGLVTPEMVLERGLGEMAPEKVLEAVKVNELSQRPELLGLVMQRVLERLQANQPVQNTGQPALPPEGVAGFGQPAIPGLQQPIPGLQGMPGEQPSLAGVM